MEKAIVEELNKALKKIPCNYGSHVFRVISSPCSITVLEGEECPSEIKSVEYIFYRFEFLMPNLDYFLGFVLDRYNIFVKKCEIPFRIMSMRGSKHETVWVLSVNHAKYIMENINALIKKRELIPPKKCYYLNR